VHNVNVQQRRQVRHRKVHLLTLWSWIWRWRDTSNRRCAARRWIDADQRRHSLCCCCCCRGSGCCKTGI